jgi:hypothetical protein
MTTVLAHLENLYTITSCTEVSEDLLLPTAGQTRLGSDASQMMSCFTGYQYKDPNFEVQPDSIYFTVRRQQAAAGDTLAYWSEQVHGRTTTTLPGITDFIWKGRVLW